jgi:hypothetical protein
MADRCMQTHSLERTSPMGGPFVGRCVLCGTEGLPASAALKMCENPELVTEDEALLQAIEGPATDAGDAQEGRRG